ncbi:hypothetical protein PSACC_02982 [Paramicrosporidium saccamoebae]|uniref:VPS37 C-terminal domain-containing protein n=1 Tax=Paramicrosporidium saccamoebae TaxID=1246581 RepID=A0A2H9THE8_9FUNG|nr:hypothetical protein PSACC_02982 [Paramicrosporidium saccamoebae]
MDKLQDCLLADSLTNESLTLLFEALSWKNPLKCSVVLLCLNIAVSLPRLTLASLLILVAITPAIRLRLLTRNVLEQAKAPTLQQIANSRTLRIVSLGIRRLVVFSSGKTSNERISLVQVLASLSGLLIILTGYQEALSVAITLLFVKNWILGSNPIRILAGCTELIQSSLIIGSPCMTTMLYNEHVDCLIWASNSSIKWSVQIYENQRWWAGIGWSNDLLRNEPMKYSNADGSEGASSIDHYQRLEKCPGVLSDGWKSGTASTFCLNMTLQKQITSLYSFFPNQVRVLQPGTVFEVPLTVGPLRVQLSLTITLPNEFPNAVPVISVTPGVAQRWVNHEMRVVGHEGLAAWHRNLSIGKIVKDIEIEFNLRPPTIVVSPISPAGQNYHSHPTSRQSEALSFPELKLLLEDDEKSEKFFESTAIVRGARSVQQELVNGNVELANVDVAKERLAELQAILELEDAELGQTNERFKSDLSKYSEKTLLDGYAEKVKESDHFSRNLVESFYSNAIDIGRFITAYQSVRKTYHQRMMSMEKLKQKLQ